MMAMSNNTKSTTNLTVPNSKQRPTYSSGSLTSMRSASLAVSSGQISRSPMTVASPHKSPTAVSVVVAVPACRPCLILKVLLLLLNIFYVHLISSVTLCLSYFNIRIKEGGSKIDMLYI